MRPGKCLSASSLQLPVHSPSTLSQISCFESCITRLYHPLSFLIVVFKSPFHSLMSLAFGSLSFQYYLLYSNWFLHQIDNSSDILAYYFLDPSSVMIILLILFSTLFQATFPPQSNLKHLEHLKVYFNNHTPEGVSLPKNLLWVPSKTTTLQAPTNSQGNGHTSGTRPPLWQFMLPLTTGKEECKKGRIKYASSFWLLILGLYSLGERERDV